MGIDSAEIDFAITEPIGYKLLACVFYGDPFHSAEGWSSQNEIGLLWKRFEVQFANYYSIFQKSLTDPHYSYELHYEPADYIQTKQYYIYVGVEIDYIELVPLDFVIKPLPLTKYLKVSAKITQHEQIEDFIQNWLKNPDSNFSQAYPYIIQRYHKDRYFGLDHPDTEMEWLIPVKKL